VTGLRSDDPLARLHPVVRLAPAKLNLTLVVLGPLPGGYHALHSVVVPLELADRLSLAVIPGGKRDTLAVVTAATAGGSSPGPPIPEGPPLGAPIPEGPPLGPPTPGGPFDPGPVEDNLVWRAVQLARRAVGVAWPGAPEPPPALAIRLEKRIPVAAGLGGGSSDAAAALDGALEAWGAEPSRQERWDLAARLGSDVPFFLAAGPALLEGRGERVTPLAPIVGPSPAVLLVVPDIRLSTAAVFAAYDALGQRSDAAAARAASIHLAAELSRGLTAQALLARAGILARTNDLLAAADSLVPELASFRRGLSRLLGRPVGLSGSGPACWVLYPSSDASGREIRARTRAPATTGTGVGGGLDEVGPTDLALPVGDAGQVGDTEWVPRGGDGSEVGEAAERVIRALHAGTLEPPAGRPPLILVTRIAVPPPPQPERR
jgi:4-diphosphocytidyl-2-C-methyl-D-erythritol kinase